MGMLKTHTKDAYVKNTNVQIGKKTFDKFNFATESLKLFLNTTT